MPDLRIAQLASFRGNIGDQANVIGTRRMLARILGDSTEYTDIEYLEYEPDPAWGGRKFDAEFVRLINKHDLFMMGGGGFFELAVDKSATGTPIDISLENLKRIKVPIVVHGMGLDISAGVADERAARFQTFFEFLLNRPNTLVSLRNDGSVANLRSVYGHKFTNLVDVIPDGGFFMPQTEEVTPDWQPSRCMAINLAGDALGFRFRDSRGSESNLVRFLAEFACVLNEVLETDSSLHLILFPHIPEDLHIIWRLLQQVGPPNMRKRVTVAPYCPGITGTTHTFNLYARCELVIGMRFHANVCPIGLGVPTIGLVTHPQIASLYSELDLTERAIDARAADFAERLGALVHVSLSRSMPIRSSYQELRAKLKRKMEAFHCKVAQLTPVTAVCRPV